jgi:hypothetical protein
VLQSRVLTDPDSSRNDSYAVWNMIELNIGLIASSLPVLRPLLSVLLDSRPVQAIARRTGLSSGDTPRSGRHHHYYMQDSIRLHSVTGQKYDVTVTTHGTSRPGDSTDDIKDGGESGITRSDRDHDRDSDELFIMQHGVGITKTVDVSVS